MNQDQFRKQVPIAIGAVMAHAIEHDLPLGDVRIGTDSYDQKIEIVVFCGLDAGIHDQWLDSLNVTDQKEARRPGSAMRCTAEVALPTSGITFTLVTYRDVQPLTVVSA